MTLNELDSLRADTMRRLLNEEGCTHIWMYDVTSSRYALNDAIDRQNYDSLEAGVAALKTGKQYALIGPGIEDLHFTTPEELIALVEWLCLRGYLSCYAKEATA